MPPANPDTTAARSPAAATLSAAPLLQAPQVAPMVASIAPATATQPRPRASTSASNAAIPARRPVALHPHSLSPAIRRPRADYFGPAAVDAAPSIADLPSNSDSILGRAVIGARSPLPPPVRQAAVLKSADSVRRVDAVYPAIARQQRMQGPVVLKVTIGADGSVREARVVSGPSMLATAAVGAVRQWRYRPARFDGSPIEVENQINVEFRLP